LRWRAARASSRRRWWWARAAADRRAPRDARPPPAPVRRTPPAPRDRRPRGAARVARRRRRASAAPKSCPRSPPACAPRLRLLPVAGRVLLQAILDGARRNPEDLGGARGRSARVLERLQDGVALERLQGRTRHLRHAVGALLGAGDGCREILDADAPLL